MKRVKLVISYDGTNYCGWQIQPNGITIEEMLNKALTALLNESIAVIGASRTDSGVHALGNVAVFDTNHRMPADKISYALNQRLPQDIRIQSSEEVPFDWHPRRQNCIKTYEYQILNRKVDCPMHRLYTHFCYLPLDIDKMKTAAVLLTGEHDFKSFCTIRSQAEETVRTIYRIDITQQQQVIKINIAGNGFLYNMVRIIVGTLIKVGTGAYQPEHIETIIDAKDRNQAGPKIPAKGLRLLSLDYEKELPDYLQGKNKYWNYILWQDRIEQFKTAYLMVIASQDLEWNGVLRRMIHQAVRNGAKTIYLLDCEKDRLHAGDVYGYYQILTISDEVEEIASWERENQKKHPQIWKNSIENINKNKQWYKVENP